MSASHFFSPLGIAASLTVAMLALLLAPLDADAQGRDGPSFDCRKASTDTEFLICDSRNLSRLDSEMAELFYFVLDEARGRRARLIRRQQADWLAMRDSCGASRRCVRQAYNERIGELSVMADDAGGGHGPVVGNPPARPRPTPGGRTTVWDHNGSEMRWASSGRNRVITYLNPRRGLSLRPGVVLFEGERVGDRMTGIAYTFRRGCRPAPYQVEGRIRSETNVTLRGAAPVRARGSCRVVNYTTRGSNAVLRFRYLYSE